MSITGIKKCLQGHSSAAKYIYAGIPGMNYTFDFDFSIQNMSETLHNLAATESILVSWSLTMYNFQLVIARLNKSMVQVTKHATNFH